MRCISFPVIIIWCNSASKQPVSLLIFMYIACRIFQDEEDEDDDDIIVDDDEVISLFGLRFDVTVYISTC